jgi:hypothetical protein
MSGAWNSAGMAGGKRGNIGHVGGIQSDFGCSRTGRLRESLFLSWWNKENRVLIPPILIILIVSHR